MCWCASVHGERGPIVHTIVENVREFLHTSAEHKIAQTILYMPLPLSGSFVDWCWLLGVFQNIECVGRSMPYERMTVCGCAFFTVFSFLLFSVAFRRYCVCVFAEWHFLPVYLLLLFHFQIHRLFVSSSFSSFFVLFSILTMEQFSNQFVKIKIAHKWFKHTMGDSVHSDFVFSSFVFSFCGRWTHAHISIWTSAAFNIQSAQRTG